VCVWGVGYEAGFSNSLSSQSLLKPGQCCQLRSRASLRLLLEGRQPTAGGWDRRAGGHLAAARGLRGAAHRPRCGGPLPESWHGGGRRDGLVIATKADEPAGQAIRCVQLGPPTPPPHGKRVPIATSPSQPASLTRHDCRNGGRSTGLWRMSARRASVAMLWSSAMASRSSVGTPRLCDGRVNRAARSLRPPQSRSRSRSSRPGSAWWLVQWRLRAWGWWWRAHYGRRPGDTVA
jgi:hypothetical protein